MKTVKKVLIEHLNDLNHELHNLKDGLQDRETQDELDEAKTIILDIESEIERTNNALKNLETVQTYLVFIKHKEKNYNLVSGITFEQAQVLTFRLNVALSESGLEPNKVQYIEQI